MRSVRRVIRNPRKIKTYLDEVIFISSPYPDSIRPNAATRLAAYTDMLHAYLTGSTGK